MRQYRTAALLLAGCVISACQWVDSTGAQNRSGQGFAPVITLVEETPARVDFSDKLIAGQGAADWVLEKEGALPACGNSIDLSQTASSLADACAKTAQSCELIIMQDAGMDSPASARYSLLAPRVSSPVGLQYRWNDMHDVTLCIDAINDAPVALADKYSASLVEPLAVDNASFGEDCDIDNGDNPYNNILANDSDDQHLNSACLTAELVQAPRYASNDFTGSFTDKGGFTYVPDIAQLSAAVHNDGRVTDTFSYRVFDGELYSETASVEIELQTGNSRPVANFDVFQAERNSRNNLINPVDNDESPFNLALSIVDIPLLPDRGGMLAVQGDLSLLYTPPRNYTGLEYFAYTITNPLGETASAFVAMRIRR